MLKKIVNLKHIKNLKTLNEEFTKNKPFENISINNFLKEEFAKELLKEIKKEEFYLEDHDIYQFLRTIDIKHSKNKKLQDFRKSLLNDEFIDFIENITQSTLDRKKIDLHSLKLLNTHYLLCHDDDIQDRKIAFIINLSENWKKEYGGQLELFDSKNNLPTNKILKTVNPAFNQFNMFKVTPGKSYHQIKEVNTQNNERISISGWYYKK